MKFRVIDNKTGKEADTYEIALHEEWAKSLVYCDMEGFMLTENGDLMLADECGTYVYCDPERFNVVFEDDRPHGEWKHAIVDCYKSGYICPHCNGFAVIDGKSDGYSVTFCPNCGSDNRPKEGEKNEV